MTTSVYSKIMNGETAVSRVYFNGDNTLIVKVDNTIVYIKPLNLFITLKIEYVYVSENVYGCGYDDYYQDVYVRSIQITDFSYTDVQLSQSLVLNNVVASLTSSNSEWTSYTASKTFSINKNVDLCSNIPITDIGWANTVRGDFTNASGQITSSSSFTFNFTATINGINRDVSATVYLARFNETEDYNKTVTHTLEYTL